MVHFEKQLHLAPDAPLRMLTKRQLGVAAQDMDGAAPALADRDELLDLTIASDGRG